MNSPRASGSFEGGGPVTGAEGGADRSEERRIGSPADGGTIGLQITQRRCGHREENEGASAFANFVADPAGERGVVALVTGRHSQRFQAGRHHYTPLKKLTAKGWRLFPAP